MNSPLHSFEHSGALSPIDVELARSLGRLAGERDETVLLATAWASRAVQAGHICADLRHLTAAFALAPELARTLPPLSPWLDSLRRSALVGEAGKASPQRPLVLDAHGRLYLARYYDHERRVADRLAELAQAQALAPEPPPAALDRLFGEHPDASEQRRAVQAAVARALSIIVGGPGTGKTSTVVKLLALQIEGALAQAEPPPRILLLAPTGKAAQRLSEATAGACGRLACADAVKREIPREATTIHRALGPVAGTTTRFQHGVGRPLDADIVLVDEASMVDLALMRRLLDALSPQARLILLGDPDQLASVEAGGVLGDVCAAAERDPAIAACVSRLTRSYRYPADSGIAQLAAAVHTQDPERALSVLAEARQDAQLYAPLARRQLPPGLGQLARTAYRGLREKALGPKLSALSAFRVLAAHRRGPTGVETLNPQLARAVHGLVSQARTHYPGRPVMVTRNDYGAALFNGDVAVLHPRSRDQGVYAYFVQDGESPREVAVGRLPDHESVYAMTIHKSQGSEFDQVAVVLPEPGSALLTRELLYTAITRARKSVRLFASAEALSQAMVTRVLRSSGLAEQLAGRATR